MTDRALSQYRSAVATEMRLAGSDYDAIARELGFANRSGAWKAVQRALAARAAASADTYREQALIDLDVLQQRNWPSAMRGDGDAIDRCLRVADQRARLMGLYESA